MRWQFRNKRSLIVSQSYTRIKSHLEKMTYTSIILSTVTCPDYQYKCPSCNNETEICVFPNSGGCLGAGIPTCQSTQCQDIFCIIERQPW